MALPIFATGKKPTATGKFNFQLNSSDFIGAIKLYYTR